MKGLYRYLAPFAPDYSGAVSVFFDTGALTVICDPGGCSGNVCGYDEMRFYGSKKLIFSAAVRDIDTILGRDDVLEKKILNAAEFSDVGLIALVGTPVVSVIGTDLKALGHIIRQKTKADVAVAETNGMDLYDRGEEKAFMGLLNVLNKNTDADNDKYILVFGALPLDMVSGLDLGEIKKIIPHKTGEKIVFAGYADSLNAFKNQRNIVASVVLSPAGLKPARTLKEKYSVPYSVFFPTNEEFKRIKLEVKKIAEKLSKVPKILIIHQQVAGNQLRCNLKTSGISSDIDVGTWFMLDKELAQSGDIAFDDEEAFIEKTDEYDIIIGDPFFKRALKRWSGYFVDFVHFAVSGDLYMQENKL